MITIEQLLESIDLDFEPGWVTQDKNGRVIIWEHRPEPHSDFSCWYRGVCGAGSYTGLKLAEFDGKDWIECIYEVPQKTTEKIEELDLSIPNNKMLTDLELIEIKINELVNAVNKLKGEQNV